MIRRSSAPRRRTGFSLAELVVTIPLAAMLTMGLASAIHLAARATPDEANPASEALAMHAALDRLTWDLRHATSIVTWTSSAIFFKVPDRNANGVEEWVSYSWSGTSGAPLMRQQNSSAPEEISSNIAQFTLTYTTRAALEGASTVNRLRLVDVVLRKATSGRGLVASTAVRNEPQAPGP